LTAHQFFYSRYSDFKNLIPFSKREIGRLKKEKLIEFIDNYHREISSVIHLNDIFQLLEYTFQSYKKVNMKYITKVNIEIFYNVGYKRFFLPHKPFEDILKEIKAL
jgi:hypothetical protein